MKFKNLLVLFLLWSCCAHAQIATNLATRIVYRLDYQPDSIDTKHIETEFFLLDFSKEQSVFRSESTHIKDSILISVNPTNLLQVAKTQFKYTIMKNSATNDLRSYHDYTTFNFVIDEEPVDFVWQLLDDTKEIIGYSCRAASTTFKGRKYIAFFTDKIPASDGPYKFKSLPGVILEIYDDQQHYHFLAVSALNLGHAYDYQLSKIADYRNITERELREFEEKVKEKPSLILQNPGIQLPAEAYEKYDRSHRERNKNRNNPIERITY